MMNIVGMLSLIVLFGLVLLVADWWGHRKRQSRDRAA